MQNNPFLKVKNNLLELEKGFIEFKDRGLKDGEENFKRQIKELFYESIIVSRDDTDKFKEQEIKKISPIKKKVVWSFH